MSGQYFENNPNLSSNEQIISYYYHGILFKFYTDNGVFSKREIDFGTSFLIQNIDPNKAKTMLDVGCGYGPIGLTMAKTNDNLKVKMLDINERAVSLANKNKEVNEVKNAEIFVSNLYEKVDDKFDLIVTNPPIRAGKQIVHEIAISAYNYLNHAGSFYAVIQKKQGAASLLKVLKEVYDDVIIVAKDRGYLVINAIKK